MKTPLVARGQIQERASFWVGDDAYRTWSVSGDQVTIGLCASDSAAHDKLVLLRRQGPMSACVQVDPASGASRLCVSGAEQVALQVRLGNLEWTTPEDLVGFADAGRSLSRIVVQDGRSPTLELFSTGLPSRRYVIADGRLRERC